MSNQERAKGRKNEHMGTSRKEEYRSNIEQGTTETGE